MEVKKSQKRVTIYVKEEIKPKPAPFHKPKPTSFDPYFND